MALSIRFLPLLVLGVSSDLPIERAWDVKLFAKHYDHESLGLGASARAFPMTNAKGETFKCFVAPPSAAASSSSAQPAPDSRARLAKFQLERHARMCVIKSMDFWSYELCVGEHVRQFHREVVPSGHSESGADHATTREFKLGTYAEGAERVVSQDGAMVLEQAYGLGTEGRTATVLYDCDAGMDLKSSAGSSSSTSAALYEITSVAEPMPLQYVLTVAVKDAQFCAQLPSPTRILAPLNHTCIEHVDGWWTYEICLGGRLRQYHSDAGNVVQESVIGIYDVNYGQNMVANAPASAAAVVQKYTSGSMCDVRKGRPREAVVRFECTPSGLTAIADKTAPTRTFTVTLISIRESPTCEYTITFGTPLVCDHPDAAPAALAVSPPPRPVMCVPDEVDDEEGLQGIRSDEEVLAEVQMAAIQVGQAVVETDGSAVQPGA